MEATTSFAALSGVEGAVLKNRPPSIAQARVAAELPGQLVAAASVTCTVALIAVTTAELRNIRRNSLRDLPLSESVRP